MIPGGENCRASGNYSFAAGQRSKANHDGAFVWAGASGGAFGSTTTNQFNVRAQGGARIFSNGGATVGVNLPSGGNAWGVISDSTQKRIIRTVEGDEVLDKLMQVPVKQWSLKTQDPSIEHIGPMAQDFYAAFGVGEDERYITTSDADGVALAAIQGLYEKVEEKEAQIEVQQQQREALEKRLIALESRLLHSQ